MVRGWWWCRHWPPACGARPVTLQGALLVLAPAGRRYGRHLLGKVVDEQQHPLPVRSARPTSRPITLGLGFPQAVPGAGNRATRGNLPAKEALPTDRSGIGGGRILSFTGKTEKK